MWFWRQWLNLPKPLKFLMHHQVFRASQSMKSPMLLPWYNYRLQQRKLSLKSASEVLVQVNSRYQVDLCQRHETTCKPNTLTFQGWNCWMDVLNTFQMCTWNTSLMTCYTQPCTRCSYLVNKPGKHRDWTLPGKLTVHTLPLETCLRHIWPRTDSLSS